MEDKKWKMHSHIRDFKRSTSLYSTKAELSIRNHDATDGFHIANDL